MGYDYRPEYERDTRVKLLDRGGAVVRTPIPEYINRAFVLDQVVVTPRGVYRPYRPYTATLATWSKQVLNAVAAITYAGRIDDVFVSKGETGLVSVKTAPVTVYKFGESFELHVDVTNLSSAAIKTGVGIVVTKPDGAKLTCPPAGIDWFLLAQGVNVKSRARINIAVVDQAGNWSAVVTYYAY